MKPLDFLGNEIKIGQRAIRCGKSYDNDCSFYKVTITDIEETGKAWKRIKIGFITDGKTKKAWTWPSRIIVEDSFNDAELQEL